MSDDMSQENESTIKEEEIQNEGKKKQFYSINLTTERVFLIFVLLIAIIAIVVVAFVFSTSSKTVSKNKDVASEEVIDEIVSNDDFAFFDDENTMELLDGEDAPAPVPEKVTITEGAENTEENVATDKELLIAELRKKKEAIKEEIRQKDEDLTGQMITEGTTPRVLTDLIGSLCDLTSGSGDKGTPVIFIQGYFDNLAND